MKQYVNENILDVKEVINKDENKVFVTLIKLQSDNVVWTYLDGSEAVFKFKEITGSFNGPQGA